MVGWQGLVSPLLDEESSAFGFIQSQNELVWMLLSDIAFYGIITDFTNIYLFGGGDLSLSLTPFFETYELKGYMLVNISYVLGNDNVAKCSECDAMMIKAFY